MNNLESSSLCPSLLCVSKTMSAIHCLRDTTTLTFVPITTHLHQIWCYPAIFLIRYDDGTMSRRDLVTQRRVYVRVHWRARNAWLASKMILGSTWLRGGQHAMLQNHRMNRVCGLPPRLMRGVLMANMGSLANRHYRPAALWHTIGLDTNTGNTFELVLSTKVKRTDLIDASVYMAPL